MMVRDGPVDRVNAFDGDVTDAIGEEGSGRNARSGSVERPCSSDGQL
jgi:hypothetical protein